MPWSLEDVPKHIKGLDAKKSAQWVQVANSVLDKCIKNGGTDATCAPSAIRQANGVVGNSESGMGVYFLPSSEYQIQERQHLGKKHLVVPVTMMVEGVHNGSHGRLLHTIVELGRFPESWNGIPIVIDHPEVDGMNVSANDPEIIDARTVGRVYKTHVDGNRLKAEAWLDEEKLGQVCPTTLARIKKKEPIEVSVGVFSDNEDVTGDWKGETYESIAKNHRPDHLALLPGGVGACSLADGCGIRLNKEGGNKMDVNATVTDMETKRAELKMSVAEFYAVPRDPPSESKLPIFDEAHVRNAMARFSQTQGLSSAENATARNKILAKAKHFGIDTTGFAGVTKNEEVIIDNENNLLIKKEDKKMSENKCPKCLEKVNALIANEKSPFAEADREWLLTQNETTLDKLSPVIIEKEKIVEKEKTVEVNKLSPEDQADLAWAKAERKKNRETMIQGIQANTSKEQWPDAEFTVLSDAQIKRIFESVKKVEEVVDYSLAGGGIQNNASKEEPLYFPGVKLEEVKK